MARSKLAVGDWVKLVHFYSGCRIGQIVEIPEYDDDLWVVTVDAASNVHCVRDDIRSRTDGPPHPYFPMRKRLPYGRYICADGSYVLHNRDYKPLVRVHTDGRRTPCDLSEWIEHIKRSEHFYCGLIPPWQDKAVFQRVVAILEGAQAPRPYTAADTAKVRARINRQNREDEKRIEPLPEWHGRPYLYMRKYRKTMYVSWGDGTLDHFREFEAIIKRNGMDADLKALWDRFLPQCNRRACFSHGGICGMMDSVPIVMGAAAVEVVRTHFIKAMNELKNLEPIES